MSDCISRQMAIEAINEDKIDLTNPNVVAVFKATGDFEKVETQVMTCDRHIKILKDLPSAQPEPHWIPCSVKVPEVIGDYLTTTIDKGVYCDFWNGVNFNRTELVIAWMPIPEPYEGDSDGTC